MDAQLRKKGFLYRCLDVSTPEGHFSVEYNGRGIGHETILVDGTVVASPESQTWFVPRFTFKIGTADALLSVRVWPWLAIRSLKLIVDGQTVYAEGSAPKVTSDEELACLKSEAREPEGSQWTSPGPWNILLLVGLSGLICGSAIACCAGHWKEERRRHS